jgi:hypothetical protein
LSTINNTVEMVKILKVFRILLYWQQKSHETEIDRQFLTNEDALKKTFARQTFRLGFSFNLTPSFSV